MINSTPKFKKIVIIIKERNNGDKYFNTTYKIEHSNCRIVLTGDYVIVNEDFNNDEGHSVKGKIYELKNIDSYKLYKN